MKGWEELNRRVTSWGFPGDVSGEESPCQFKRHKRPGFHPWVRKITWRRKWQPAPVFLPEKSHGQKNLWATVHEVTKTLHNRAHTQAKAVTSNGIETD